MIGQGFEDLRAVDAEGRAEQEYFNRLDQKSKMYDLDNGTGITEKLSNAEAGKRAKQSARDNKVASVVGAAKDQELGVMYNRFKSMMDEKQYENDVLKEYIGNGLASQGALR